MTTTTAAGATTAGTGAAAALRASNDYCRALTKREAANFYFGMKLLKEPKRSAMYALYAYMRLVDDIADDDARQRTLQQRRDDLDHWEHLTRSAVEGGRVGLTGEHASALWPAFADMVASYRIPAKIFEDMIAGQRQDLEPVRIGTFEDLYQYCYRVASVVGMASLYVWGFEGGEETLKLSVMRGIAFQLTNVLRDVREDSARGRCYVPAEDLERFGIAQGAMGAGEAGGKKFVALMEFEIERARGYYEKSAALERQIAADARPTLVAMTGIYRGILEKIAVKPERVLRQRVRLSTLSKLMIGWRAMRGR